MSEPVDINKNRKDSQRTADIQAALQSIFVKVCEGQNYLSMRIEDLQRDYSKLNMEVEELIGELYGKYPELEPNLEEEEVEE